MPKSRSPLATVILAALALALLYALNPTLADFQAWRSAQAQGEAATGKMTGLIGVMKKGAGAVAGALTGGGAGLYPRKDYLLFSTYSLGGDNYLGIARLFIKIR